MRAVLVLGIVWNMIVLRDWLEWNSIARPKAVRGPSDTWNRETRIADVHYWYCLTSKKEWQSIDSAFWLCPYVCKKLTNPFTQDHNQDCGFMAALCTLSGNVETNSTRTQVCTKWNCIVNRRIWLTWLHPCYHPIQTMWWFIWEVTVVLCQYILSCTQLCDKLNNCNLPSESSHDLGDNKDANALAEYIYHC